MLKRTIWYISVVGKLQGEASGLVSTVAIIPVCFWFNLFVKYKSGFNVHFANMTSYRSLIAVIKISNPKPFFID
jgi:hypothetical protein